MKKLVIADNYRGIESIVCPIAGDTKADMEERRGRVN